MDVTQYQGMLRSLDVHEIEREWQRASFALDGFLSLIRSVLGSTSDQDPQKTAVCILAAERNFRFFRFRR